MKWVSAVIPGILFLFVAVSSNARAEHDVYVNKTRTVLPDGSVVKTKVRTVYGPNGVSTTVKVRGAANYWPAYGGYSPYNCFNTPAYSNFVNYGNWAYNTYYNPSTYYANPYWNNYGAGSYSGNTYYPSNNYYNSYPSYSSYPTTTGVSYSRSVTWTMP